MVIEPQMYIPGDAKAESSGPLSTPPNLPPQDKRMAGIDETDKGMKPPPVKPGGFGNTRARRIAELLQELQALQNANQSSPKDYQKSAPGTPGGF
jgi:hypothetical protein